MKFAFNPAKNELNIAKHGLSLSEAISLEEIDRYEKEINKTQRPGRRINVTKAAKSDPDSKPLSDKAWAKVKPTPDSWTWSTCGQRYETTSHPQN